MFKFCGGHYGGQRTLRRTLWRTEGVMEDVMEDVSEDGGRRTEDVVLIPIILNLVSLFFRLSKH